MSSPARATTRCPSRTRRVLVALLATLVALALLAVLAAWRLGPRYGYHLFPPAPAQYADQVLTHLDQGLHAAGSAWQAARARAVAETRAADSYAATIPALQAPPQSRAASTPT